MLAVAGLRNVGTKVGYSSFGPRGGHRGAGRQLRELTAAPACGPSIPPSTTGLTAPGANTYTNQTNPNLGTSFSAPIVSGIAALMRAVNANLTPPQLIARIKSSATPFPQPAGLARVPDAVPSSSGECACPTTHQCGAGMVNALSAVKAALNPIAAVKIPAGFTTGSATFDASGSVAACGVTHRFLRVVASTGAVAHQFRRQPAAQVNVTSTGAGTLTAASSRIRPAIPTRPPSTFTAERCDAPAAPSSAGTSGERLRRRP